MAIRKTTEVKYVDEERGFEYEFEPVEDSIQVETTTEGFTVQYLSQDEHPMSPDEMDDDGLFLVQYHRQFHVENKNVNQDDLAEYYQLEGEFPELNAEYDNGEFAGARALAEKYWIFPVTAYIHSGVSLHLGTGAGWDQSKSGAVLVKKADFGSGGVQFEYSEERARTMAESLIETWNQYLSGDVYGIVKEYFDKDKMPTGEVDSCWGFYGLDDAREALKDGDY